jgi:hypothetical protein
MLVAVRSFFITERAGWGARKVDDAGNLRFRVGNGYVELMFRQESGVYAVVCAMPTGWRQLALGTCWGRMFDNAPEALATCDNRSQELLGATYPILMNLIVNSALDQLDDVALVQYLDPDDNIGKWFIAKTINNVDLDDFETWLTDHGDDEIFPLLGISFAVVEELQSNPTLAERLLGLQEP